MDAGGYHPRVAPVNVGELFETLEAEFGALARQKGLRLRRVACSAVVRSDAQLLRRIVQNLLSNALKYTDSGSIRSEEHTSELQSLMRISYAVFCLKKKKKKIYRKQIIEVQNINLSTFIHNTTYIDNPQIHDRISTNQ